MLLGKVNKLYNIDSYTFGTNVLIITTTFPNDNSDVMAALPSGIYIYSRLGRV